MSDASERALPLPEPDPPAAAPSPPDADGVADATAAPPAEAPAATPEPKRCCKSPETAHRLMRLVSVVVGGRPAMRPVDEACANCGKAVLLTGEPATLPLTEIVYARSLLAKGRAFAAAVALGDETDAATLGLPTPGELDDLGLSARLCGSMVLDPAVVDRNVLLGHLGIAVGKHRMIDVPGPLGQVRVDEYAVIHLEEKRAERWEPAHVGFFPLVENTLQHPFEIWFGAGAKREEGEKPNFRFLSLYQLDGICMTHLVVYSPRRKKVISSHKLTGWPQAMGRRSGVPVYAAYAP